MLLPHPHLGPPKGLRETSFYHDHHVGIAPRRARRSSRRHPFDDASPLPSLLRHDSPLRRRRRLHAWLLRARVVLFPSLLRGAALREDASGEPGQSPLLLHGVQHVRGFRIPRQQVPQAKQPTLCRLLPPGHRRPEKGVRGCERRRLPRAGRRHTRRSRRSGRTKRGEGLCFFVFVIVCACVETCHFWSHYYHYNYYDSSCCSVGGVMVGRRRFATRQ